jgi:hypothetical protein
MSVLVSVETVLLVLLVVLVAGLLRSHAEILRRLGPEAAPGAAAVPPPVPAARGDVPGRPAAALQGSTPAGDAVALDFSRGAGTLTLLAFLSSGCGTCATFWATLAQERLPAGVEAVIVTRGSERESPARIGSLAPDGVPVVMSSQAWTDYEVPGSPYFVLVADTVLGEGVAANWRTLVSLVADAVQDETGAAPAGRPAGPERARAVEETLIAGGIGPEHPSLYPSRSSEPV